jgi:FKBP-type peptidyl-prolyl cis-trans isomerase FkpA
MRKARHGPVLVALVLLGAPAFAASSQSTSAPAAPAPPPGALSDDEKAMHALGFALWRGVQTFDLTPAEVETVVRAFREAAAGAEPVVSMEEARPLLEALRQKRMEQRSAAQKAAGKAFADKAATEPGAVRSASGMVYRESVPGTGATPSESDRVKVHYRGTLIDGTEFESSQRRNQPAQFRLDEVVPCWSEALRKMRAGGKATVVCPSEIAYGDRGRPSIPPGATLVFDIELLEVVAKAEAPAADE